MKQKKIKLSRNVAGRWSYEDDVFEKDYMTTIEVVAMFIARFAASIQEIDNRDEVVGIEVMLKKC